jgi:putative addiction module killer protein
VEARPRELENYVTADDEEPFEDWLEGLDSVMRGIIDARLIRVRNGNLGNSHGVGEGVSELVIDVGPGWRVYFGQDGDTVVLLTGGTKKTQLKDIANAKKFWRDYRA